MKVWRAKRVRPPTVVQFCRDPTEHALGHLLRLLGVPKLQGNDKSKELKISDLIDNGIGAPTATKRLGDIMHFSTVFACGS